MRVEPELGALISSFRRLGDNHALDLFHSPPERPVDPTGIHRFGCWPLIPFANRCAGGRLFSSAVVHQLPINDPANDRTMHGCGWQRPWVIDAESRSDLRLTLRVADFGPYCFDAAIELRLTSIGASFAIALTNIGRSPLPFGMGFHPWFPCMPDTLLKVPSARRVLFESGFKAKGVVEVDAETDFRTARSLWRDTEIAVNFLDCSGPVTLTYPRSHRLYIVFDDVFRAPLLWRPPGAGYVCFEPQSHVLGAPGGGKAAEIAPLRILGPQETMRGQMDISVEKIS